jgi:catechol 2,3-dioxygenase-like lactoylglutathione lyase family enzyme
VKILFVAGFGPITADVAASRRLYQDALGLQFKEEQGEYLHTEKIDGVKTFAIWPLTQAAESCFGRPDWPTDIPAPQAWLEFDVDDVAGSADELIDRGYRVLVKARTEPWGQVVSRVLSPEGLLVGLTMTPWMRQPG